jgi:hypothetical protein
MKHSLKQKMLIGDNQIQTGGHCSCDEK